MSRQPSSLAALAGDLPADLVARLRAAHDEIGFMCAARDEGQACCLDYLLTPAVTAPAGLAAATGSVTGPGDEG